MAIPLQRAQQMAEALKAWNNQAFDKVEIKGSQNEVVCLAKSATLRHRDLTSLGEITKGWTVTFGRSGANFRMIVW